jgi:hypothetical protein
MKFVLFSVLLAIVTSSGCANMSPLKTYPEADNDSNNVTILRNYNFYGGGIHFWPTVNGERISGLLTNQHTSILLPKGTYVFGVKCSGGLGNRPLEVTLSDNDRRYFLLTPAFFGCAEIDAISESDARGRLAHSVRIQSGYVSTCKRVAVPFSETRDRLCFFP